MNPSVSIIIPIYNVEAYLRQCIESTGMLGCEDVEIILVNDGSADGSVEICREYDKKWDNVVLIEKLNGGLSDARNWGTEAATGEFLFYLDSDDWLAPDAIDTLYRFAIESGCDVVQGGFYYAYNDYCLYDDRWFSESQEPFVLNQHDAICELIKNHYVKNFAWGKLYKSSIVNSHKFPVGKYYEDSYWQYRIIAEVNQYAVIPQSVYYYRQRPDSISGRSSERLLDLLEGNESMLDFIRDHYPDLTEMAADQLWRSSFGMRNNGVAFNQFYERVEEEYSSFFSDSLKSSVLYKLAGSRSSLLPLYLFLRRVKNRFFTKSLMRIKK